MKITLLLTAAATVVTFAAASPLAAQSAADDARFSQAQARFDREYQLYREEAERYRAARGSAASSNTVSRYRRAGDPYAQNAYNDERDENGYDPARDYRSGSQYRERVLSADDRVYAGEDGRYYCKRSDGTTGLIVGAAGGGILGNVIDGGRSRSVGTLLGAAAGALAGRAVQQSNDQVRCR